MAQRSEEARRSIRALNRIRSVVRSRPVPASSPRRGRGLGRFVSDGLGFWMVDSCDVLSESDGRLGRLTTG